MVPADPLFPKIKQKEAHSRGERGSRGRETEFASAAPVARKNRCITQQGGDHGASLRESGSGTGSKYVLRGDLTGQPVGECAAPAPTAARRSMVNLDCAASRRPSALTIS